MAEPLSLSPATDSHVTAVVNSAALAPKEVTALIEEAAQNAKPYLPELTREKEIVPNPILKSPTEFYND